MLLRAFFRTRYIHTPFCPWLFVLDSSLPCIGCDSSSRAVSNRPARANLATRLGSSRFVNFFRGRYTLAEVHFRYPFSRHDFWCDGRDSRWRFVTGRNYPANCRKASPFLRPVTDRVYWTSPTVLPSVYILSRPPSAFCPEPEVRFTAVPVRLVLPHFFSCHCCRSCPTTESLEQAITCITGVNLTCGQAFLPKKRDAWSQVSVNYVWRTEVARPRGGKKLFPSSMTYALRSLHFRFITVLLYLGGISFI